LIKPQPTVLERRIDYFGNHVTSFAIQEPHTKLVVTAVSKVHVAPLAPIAPDETASWETVRDHLRSPQSARNLEACQFTFDSPHVKCSEGLKDYAAQSFTPNRPILAAALELTERIHREFRYDKTATTVSTPLEDVLRLRRGVCQDFAHLEIGALRSLGLAARYISGYLLTLPPPGQPRLIGADASHAWITVYCGDAGWVDLDPTNNLIPSTSHISLAWGRDYSDVCPINGVFIGGGQHGMNVWVDVLPLS
jgi:transglutaminase-like putative cysteine protease